MPWLAAIVAFGGVIGPLFLMLGLARTSAASGSLLLNLEGLATMAIAWVVFRENVDRRLLLGAASILAGGSCCPGEGRGIRVDGGGLLIAAACLAWGIDNNLTRKLSSADPVVIALIKGLVAGSVNLIWRCFSARACRRRRDGRGVRRRVVRRRGQSRACLCWRCAISAAPERALISRSRRSLARSSRSCC